MSAQRFAVYRDRAPFAPTYLGDVLADDRDHAVRLGTITYGAPVVAHRSTASMLTAPPQLERAVAAVERRRARTAQNHTQRGGR